jgi:ABC-type glycerol-3-phosphate transport system permease component
MIRKISFVLLFVLLLTPFYFMLIGSVQNMFGIMIMPPRLIPYEITMFNYHFLLFGSKDMAGGGITLKWNSFQWLVNTLFIVSGTVCASVFISTTAGYSFAFYKFKFKKVLWSLFLLGIMIPRISMIIPTFVIVKKLQLSGTLFAVILSTSFAPMGMYLAKIFFQSIPISLLESARLDGASERQILQKIVIPVSRPIITALSLFASIGALQDYIWQMLILQSADRQTLLVGFIRAIMIRGGGDLNVNPLGKSFAAGVLLLLPLLIVFLIANKYFVESLGGAIKE